MNFEKRLIAADSNAIITTIRPLSIFAFILAIWGQLTSPLIMLFAGLACTLTVGVSISLVCFISTTKISEQITPAESRSWTNVRTIFTPLSAFALIWLAMVAVDRMEIKSPELAYTLFTIGTLIGMIIYTVVVGFLNRKAT